MTNPQVSDLVKAYKSRWNKDQTKPQTETAEKKPGAPEPARRNR